MWIDIFQQLAWCYYDLGAYQLGLEYCQKAINRHASINSTGRAPAFAVLALLQIRSGNLSEAEAAVKKGWENFDLGWQTYYGWWETLSILEAEAELALAQIDLERAAHCIDQLLGKYDELKLRHLKPGILLLKSRVALAAGDKEEAHQTLCNALALSDEMGAHRDVWGMCWALRELETDRANEACATQYKERALNEVMLIAEHTGTPELREIFLSRPDVQVILNAE